jgi:hypothetical protein
VALTLTINGVDKTSLLKDGSLDVEKTGPTESCRLDILVKADNTASAYRPVVGDVMRLLHNAYLLMGGPIVRVEDRRLGGDSGTVTRITVRDWLFLAEQVIIEDRYFPPTPAYELFDDLVTTYLADKGVTNIGASTGGPALPELFVKGETLLSVFLQMTEQTGYPFRINGDKECVLVEPGSLVWPGGGLTVSNIIDGLTWTKDELVQANRLHLTTGTPEVGAGPITFHETHIADGVMQVFPVNVIPNRTLVGRIDNAAGYAAAATSIALKDLTPGMALLQDDGFTIVEHASNYILMADAMVDEDGKVTLSISPGLDDVVVDEDAVTFRDETGITLRVNGTPINLFGTDWVWDRLEQAVVNEVTPPIAADEITIESRVTFPAVVRVWETSSVDVQESDGHFDYGVIVDGTIDGQTHTDLPQAAAYARDVLTRRLTPPKVVRCTTFEQGWYPFLSTTITWGARLVSGSYMVDTVRIRAIGIDPAATTTELPYELELVEGDAMRQSWVDYYKGQNPARGIRWGYTPEPVVNDLPLANLTTHFDASRQEDLYSTYVSGGPHTGVPGDGDPVGAWKHAQGDDMVFRIQGSQPLPILRQDTTMGQQSLDWDNGPTVPEDTSMRLTDFSGADIALSNLITASTYTMYIAFHPDTIVSTDATYNGEPLLADTAGYWGVFLARVGGAPKVVAYNYDGNADYVILDCSVGSPHVVMVRHEGGTLYASIDGGSESSIASGSTSSLTGTPKIGYGVYGFGTLDAHVGEIAIYNAAQTSDERDEAIAYFMGKWF